MKGSLQVPAKFRSAKLNDVMRPKINKIAVSFKVNVRKAGKNTHSLITSVSFCIIGTSSIVYVHVLRHQGDRKWCIRSQDALFFREAPGYNHLHNDNCYTVTLVLRGSTVCFLCHLLQAVTTCLEQSSTAAASSPSAISLHVRHEHRSLQKKAGVAGR